jgi:hypothetical protein
LLKAPSVDSVFIDSVAPTTYVANNGLKFFIRPNILVPALGVEPIAGLVSIEHVLLKKRGDFISANVPTTTTANQLLESGAAVFIKIKKGDAMLQTLPTATIGINFISTPFTSNGQLYYTSSPLYNWLVNPNPNQNIVTTTTQGFEIATNTLGWLQVANAAAAGTVNIIAALDSQFTNKNTVVFLSVNGKISIVKFEGNFVNKTFNSIAPIAQGKEVTVITMSKIANKNYFGSKVFVTQNVAGSANQRIQIQPQISSLQQITTYLQAL